jgi:hypothetical protein
LNANSSSESSLRAANSAYNRSSPNESNPAGLLWARANPHIATAAMMPLANKDRIEFIKVDQQLS